MLARGGPLLNRGDIPMRQHPDTDRSPLRSAAHDVQAAVASRLGLAATAVALAATLVIAFAAPI